MRSTSVLIPRSALVVVVKVFGQLLPQHFISLALMTECYSAFKQPLLDVLGKIAPKIDDRRTMTRANRSSLWFGMAGSDDSTLTTKSIAPSRPVVSGVLSNVAFVGCFVRFIIWPPLRRLTLTLILYDRNG